ncbi:uncharacterized protein LOC142538210 isoform X2 [Primulina tabacum]|uniref:uncharacterized protein LOC142538210 isoform X2 n=1 Tax=Primulina tabacum TaxID=48773 RepID=UPI003F597144
MMFIKERFPYPSCFLSYVLLTFSLGSILLPESDDPSSSLFPGAFVKAQKTKAYFKRFQVKFKRRKPYIAPDFCSLLEFLNSLKWMKSMKKMLRFRLPKLFSGYGRGLLC